METRRAGLRYEPFDSDAARQWTGFLTGFIVSRAADELAKIASGADQEPTPVERWAIRRFLDWFRDSELVKEQHASHVAAPTVTHLLKGTPFVDAKDDQKLSFAASYVGRLVARIIKEEGEYVAVWTFRRRVAATPRLGRGYSVETSNAAAGTWIFSGARLRYLREWKVDKIREAAGPDYDAALAAADLAAEIQRAEVVFFSFEDCPWCVAAKQLLAAYDDVLEIPLEPLGQRGKALRAAIAAATGRTSLPALWVRGEPVGGYTDGTPGLLALERSGELERRLRR